MRSATIARQTTRGVNLRDEALLMLDNLGLIRHHQLSSGFARHLDKALRPVFRKLVCLIQRENSGQ
jgi:hypothetical protein